VAEFVQQHADEQPYGGGSAEQQGRVAGLERGEVDAVWRETLDGPGVERELGGPADEPRQDRHDRRKVPLSRIGIPVTLPTWKFRIGGCRGGSLRNRWLLADDGRPGGATRGAVLVFDGSGRGRLDRLDGADRLGSEAPPGNRRSFPSRPCYFINPGHERA
jgi:hypothetical protein